MHKLLPLKRSL